MIVAIRAYMYYFTL